MSDTKQALVFALEQIVQTQRADVRRIDEDRHRDRTEIFGRFDGFEHLLRESVRDMRDCGEKQHARIEAKLDLNVGRIDAKLEAQDAMLDDLAIAAGNAAGKRSVVTGAIKGAANLVQQAGVLQFAVGLLLASCAPRAYELVVQGVAHAVTPDAAAQQPEPTRAPAPVNRSHVAVELPAQPLELRGR